MLKRCLIVIILCAASVRLAAAGGPVGANHMASLAGVWKAEPYAVERATNLDIEVFGPHAQDVRKVTLTIQASGQARLTISTWVVDQKGRTYSPSVTDAKLTIDLPVPSSSNRIQPEVTVDSAEERYLDGSGDRWPVVDSRVTITLPTITSNTMEFRFDTHDGRGSFGDTLTRQHKR